MNIAIAFVFMNIVCGSEPIPTTPGASWTVEKTEEDNVLQQKWKVVALPKDFSADVFGASERGSGESMLVTPETRGFVGVEIEEDLTFLLQTTAKDQRLYVHQGWGMNLYTILCVLPRNIQEGSSWTTFLGRFCCGVSIEAFEAKASRLPLDTFAGKKAFRLSWNTLFGENRIDIVPGVGIFGHILDVSVDRWKTKAGK